MIRSNILVAMIGFPFVGLCQGGEPSESTDQSSKPPVVQVERLYRLADRIAELQSTPQKLDMRKFWNEIPGDDQGYCAGGHATQIPEFASAGLILKDGTVPGSSNYGMTLMPYYNGVYGQKALIQFFGISLIDYRELFAGNQTIPNDPLSVSRRIRAVADRERACRQAQTLATARREIYRKGLCELAAW